eukprot:496208-Pelagomonas_calceolata.AAC.1
MAVWSGAVRQLSAGMEVHAIHGTEIHAAKVPWQRSPPQAAAHIPAVFACTLQDEKAQQLTSLRFPHKAQRKVTSRHGHFAF